MGLALACASVETASNTIFGRALVQSDDAREICLEKHDVSSLLVDCIHVLSCFPYS